jgi:hypothetical protein
MTEIHLIQDIQSDTLKLPELQPLIGKTVEIIIRDLSQQSGPANPWDGLQSLAGQDLVDPDAYRQLRDLDRQQFVG